MRAAWRIAISSLSGRRSRTLLLMAAVALSAGLIVAVACAMASLNLAVGDRIKAVVGSADVRLRHVNHVSFDAAVAEQARKWPGVTLVIPRARESITLINEDPRPVAGETSVKGQKGGKGPARWGVVAYGVVEDEFKIRPLVMQAGQRDLRDGTVVIDGRTAAMLGASVGQKLKVELFGAPAELLVTGISKPPALGAMVEREEVYLTIAALGKLSGNDSRVGEVDILLERSGDATAFVEAHKKEVPDALILQSTEKITSGLDKNLRAQDIGFLIASVLSFLASCFIVTTGLTTRVAERTRELAILRSIGATRRQLGVSQLFVGAIVGIVGALVGVPVGALGAFIVVKVFPEQLPGGFAFAPLGVFLAATSCAASGLFGALWPAVHAARVSPLEGLSSRSRKVRGRWVWVCLGAGLLGALVHVAVVSAIGGRPWIFWVFIGGAVPSLMVGYFLLGVPLMWVMSRALAPVLTKLLVLPPRVLGRTLQATPFRHGFTAAAMMLGLSIMVSIWTNGRAVMRDWLDAFQLPDAFLYKLNMTPEDQAKVAAIPGVAQTCAITVQAVGTDAFGISGLTNYNTSFVGFEPDAFFAMTKLTWVQPVDDAGVARAKRRLGEGGAVIVERAFLAARGLGVGDTLTLGHKGKKFDFEIVGVVTSPGLDIVSKFVEVGEQYMSQAINAVCGSRKDLIEKFGNESISFLQYNIVPGSDGKKVLEEAKRVTGALVGVSATEMKDKIRGVISGSLKVLSTVGIGSLLVACFGVANLIIAGIQARQFEFGVLRAVGATRWMLGRLVLGEALIIAVVACILGTALGFQGSWAGLKINAVAIGLQLEFRPQWDVVVLGSLLVTAITLGAAMPAIAGLMRMKPRELIAAMKG